MILESGEWIFNWPLAEHIITAGWFYSDGSEHRALDFRAAVGTPVFGVAGVVDWVQKWDGKTKTGNQSYGNLVRIRCNAKYKGKTVYCLYAHLSAVNVTVGEQISDGQMIGLTGNTGNSTGPHLHFEVRLNGQRVNPLNWLDADFTVANGYVKLGEYTSVKRPEEKRKLQTMCIIDATDDIAAKAEELGLPVTTVTAKLIGPASDGDAMTLWGMSKSSGCKYFSRYEE